MSELTNEEKIEWLEKAQQLARIMRDIKVAEVISICGIGSYTPAEEEPEDVSMTGFGYAYDHGDPFDVQETLQDSEGQAVTKTILKTLTLELLNHRHAHVLINSKELKSKFPFKVLIDDDSENSGAPKLVRERHAEVALELVKKRILPRGGIKL